MQTIQHHTDIEDNGMRGEELRWLPVCDCGWVAGQSFTRLAEAEDEATDHVVAAIRGEK